MSGENAQYLFSTCFVAMLRNKYPYRTVPLMTADPFSKIFLQFYERGTIFPVKENERHYPFYKCWMHYVQTPECIEWKVKMKVEKSKIRVSTRTS